MLGGDAGNTIGAAVQGATIAGGSDDVAGPTGPAIATGVLAGTFPGQVATVGGGAKSQASGVVATVAGGLQNLASGNASSVTGRLQNAATGRMCATSDRWRRISTRLSPMGTRGSS